MLYSNDFACTSFRRWRAAVCTANQPGQPIPRRSRAGAPPPTWRCPAGGGTCGAPVEGTLRAPRGRGL